MAKTMDLSDHRHIHAHFDGAGEYYQHHHQHYHYLNDGGNDHHNSKQHDSTHYHPARDDGAVDEKANHGDLPVGWYYGNGYGG